MTPDEPIRLSGYGGRREESSQIVQALYVRALALDDGVSGPAVILTVDNVGVPAWLSEQTAQQLANEFGMPRERLCVSSTHTHTAPMLRDSIPNMFGEDVPAEHQQRIDRYSEYLGEQMLTATRAALAGMQPATLAAGRGTLGFAANRRTAGGPVDHTLPFLLASAADGRALAIVANYACHCTTLGGGDNFICGDWAGYAAEALEQDRDGAVALITIGCGADANPLGGGLEQARAHGRALADEVWLQATRSLAPLRGPLRARFERIELPYAALPDEAAWRARLAQGGAIAYHANKHLDRLARGENLPATLSYPVATWCFGTDLALVFLGGEVVVDYALRLRREHDAARLWITAYANDVPCYIPSERILREGGYEAEGAMVYYDRPTRLAEGVEQRIVDVVRAQLPDAFRNVLGVDVGRTEGIAPRAPPAALAALRTHPRFRVELVAAEPMLDSPVALDFGADGSLWVCEMRDYPLGLDGRGAPGGRIVVLRDRDRDGRTDSSTVFLDGLSFPTGVSTWRQGALICASSEILYAEDRDGDDRADAVRALYRGFRTDNYQARVNSLSPGLDGWIWGASGIAPDTIESIVSGARVDLRGRDFRIRPATGELEPVSGITQQGRCRDDFGAWFGCDNSTLLRHYPLDDRYLRRNPYLSPPRIEVLVPRGADPNRLYPVAPVLERFNDLGMAGRATSACGIAIYRDDLLGADCAGNSFTAETVHNLVTRLQLSDDGASFSGARAEEEQQREFLASADPWFRPVQVRTGPDGALYVVDMCRFVIEHPTWIPAERLAQLDVRAGAGLGRIWRVVPAERPLRPVPRLDHSDGPSLVLALSSPNGTVRDLAQQRILELDSAPLAELRALARGDAPPAARVQALATLASLGALRPEDLLPALGHPHPGVRVQAIRLSEPHLDQDARLLEAVCALARDAHARVRLQAACSLGESRSPIAARALAERLFADDADEHVRAGLLSSALPHLEPLLASALSRSASGGRVQELAEELLRLAARSDHRAALAAATQGIVRLHGEDEFGDPLRLAAALFAAADGRGEGAQELTAFPGGERLALTCATARQWLAARRGDEERRAQLLQLLGREPALRAQDHARLGELLGGVEPVVVQRAALAAIERLADRLGPETILSAWERAAPTLRPALLDALMARGAWTHALLDALETRPEIRAAFDAARRARLIDHEDPVLQARARAIFAVTAGVEQRDLFARFAAARTLPGDRARGAASFAANCSLCHRLDGVGFAVGPDLAALSDRSAAALLTAILDPDRAINPEYVNYLVRLKDGRTMTGLIRDETSSGFRLIGLAGVEIEMMRSSVMEIVDTRASMMPKGFEQQLTPADVADLAAYLQSLGEQPKAFDGNRPASVSAAADGSLEVRAAHARIFGPSLVFEQPFGNLGYWHHPTDRAEWELSTDAEADWDVHLDYACDGSAAGNRFVLSSALGELAGEVVSTGGWAHYRSVLIGRLRLPSGPSRLSLRPQGELRHALMDLRALRLVPAGSAAPASAASDAARAMRQLLAGWQPGGHEELERIPALWQLAIGAGRSNQDDELRTLLDLALPAPLEPLAQWRAVVIGGGLVNGLTQSGVWPGERLRELCAGDPVLLERLERAIELAVALAHDESAPHGTRYDAMRMLGIGAWETLERELLRYLERDAPAELQMGSVSALGDCADPRAREWLRVCLHALTPDNRSLAAAALQRLPTLEQVLASPFDLWGEAAIHQPDGPSYDFFAALLPPLRYVNTAFRHYPIVLSAPNARVKARFVSNGSGVNLLAASDAWSDAGLLPVEFLLTRATGELEAFGGDPTRLHGPVLADGWLPIVQLRYELDGARVEQEAFAGMDPDDAVTHARFRSDAACGLQVRFGGSAPLAHEAGVLRDHGGRVLARHDGSFRYQAATRSLIIELNAGDAAHLALPTRGADDDAQLLTASAWEQERARCAAYWRDLVAQGAQIHTGEARVDEAWRALIAGTLTMVQSDVLHYGHGNLYQTTFEAECGDAVRAMIALGVPDARRLVRPLLERPYQAGLALNDLAFKLQLYAWCHAFLRDPEWSRAQLGVLLPEAERSLGWIEAASGMVPAQAYCGDLQTPCHNLYANAAYWRGLRDLALVLRGLGGPEETAAAARFEAKASSLRARVLEAVAASERLDVSPPFIPIALFGVEQPYQELTQSMQGSYWNLVAPFVYDSGIFGPDSARERAMLDWQLERGGTALGMLRFDQHSGLFANGDGLDDLYTLRHAEALLRRGDAERVLAGFYGKLAQGMTRDTYVGGEGSSLRSLDARGRPMYLPPNASANAYFLWTLRHLLVHEVDEDRDGRADQLTLLGATPRAWLADGGRIAVERMPTPFGAVSLEVVSEVERGRVRVRVDLPATLAVPAAIHLRLPDAYLLQDSTGRFPLPAGGGRIEFEAATRPRPK